MDTQIHSAKGSLSFIQTPAPISFSAGEILEGKYRIIEELAHGGMGTVYRAEHLHLHREVAIKVLRTTSDHSDDNKEFVQRFKTEASILARIRHPNAVMVYDFGFLHGSPYLVMDLVDGESLRARLRDSRRLGLKPILEIAEQVCSAIHHAHERGVVHRDLKPDNIIVTESSDGSYAVTVLDFGIAKLLDDTSTNGSNLTQTGVIVGTPQYMSPEQFRSAALDGRSDVYAVGIMLYELLSGRLPFVADSAISLALMQLNEAPPAFEVDSLRVPVSPELRELVMRCLEKKPENRPASAEELRRLLAEIRTGIFQTTATVINRAYTPNRASRRAAALCVPLMLFMAWPSPPVVQPPVKPRVVDQPLVAKKLLLDDNAILEVIFKAKDFKEQGHYLEAIENYKLAIEMRPEAPELSRAMADCFVSLGDYDSARNTLQEAVKRQPKDAQNFVQLGYVESELGNHRDAVTAYQTAVELGVSDEVVLNNLGVEFQKVGRYSEAVPVFVKAIRQNNNYLRAIYNLAESQEKLGKWDKASSAYELAIRIDQNNAGAYQRLAGALTKAGRKEDARLAQLNAMRLMPGFDDFENYARKQETIS